jgi:uncharacterized membrane protein
MIILLIMLGLDIANWLAGALGMLPDWLIVFIISMTPFVELRLSLPLALALFKMPWATAFVIAIIGNIIPVPLVLLFLGKAEKWLRKYSWWDSTLDKVFDYTRRRAKDSVKKYGAIGLCLYVAIPLPVTGAWTGALIAYVFALDPKQAFFSITGGVLIAGVIVLLVTLGALSVFY